MRRSRGFRNGQVNLGDYQRGVKKAALYGGYHGPDVWHTGIMGLREAVTEREWRMVREGLKDSVISFREVSKLLRERLEKVGGMPMVGGGDQEAKDRYRLSLEAYMLSRVLRQLQGVMVSVSAVHLVGKGGQEEVEVEVG